MPLRLLVFVRRRQELSPAEFRDYYEGTHIPLVTKMCGDVWPLSTRHYITRSDDASKNYPIQYSVHGASYGEGGPAFDFDCVTEVVYDDQAHFDRHMAVLAEGDNGRIREEDEGKFIAEGSIRVIRVQSCTGIATGN